MLENKKNNEQFSYSVWDMVLFEKAKEEKDLEVFFNTVMYDCETKDDRIVSIYCVQETTEMRYQLYAPVFVDATGNGTLGYYAVWRIACPPAAQQLSHGKFHFIKSKGYGTSGEIYAAIFC